jgi:pectin methylesterase-like acyl-CoA thioesterase
MEGRDIDIPVIRRYNVSASDAECLQSSAGGNMRKLVPCLAPGPSRAETHVVTPDGTGDFPTIQAAIDAAVDGDEVVLTHGVFTGDGNRDVNFLGKAITIRSQDGGPSVCIIDCKGSFGERHRGFRFDSREGRESVLSGVTVSNGYAPIEPPTSEMSGDRRGAIKEFCRR